MSEIVNLRQARKRKARAAHEAEAGANRAKHGQSKLERALQRGEAEKLAKTLEGARKDRPADS